MVQVKEDLTGKTFGRLTVLCQVDDYITPSGKHLAKWRCVCSCEEHNIVEVLGMRLTRRNNSTKSCGCLYREHSIFIGKTHHKTNQYDLSGEYGIGWTTNTNKEFYFDLEDYNKIKDYCWNENIDKSTGYHVLTTCDYNSSYKTIKMHKILGYLDFTDHKDRNPLNNRRSNLRTATPSENMRNHSKRKDNTSGFTGITYDKRRDTWTVRISIDGKFKHIGSFKNKDDAVIARLKAEQKYYGEFAPQRHLFEQYNISTEQNDSETDTLKENNTNEESTDE